MKKTIYMIFVLTGIMAMSATMTGCSNTVKADQVDLTEQVAKVNKENEVLKEEIKQLQQNNQKLDEEIAKLDPIKTEEKAETVKKEEVTQEQVTQEVILTVYSADVNTYERESVKEIKVDDSLSIEEKLKSLAEELSKTQFDNAIIELHKIENQDGKKIAIINLMENPEKTDASWQSVYFQGSTGGTITTVSLQETFLQKDYQGDWVDGVTFRYNTDPIVFDHVEPLGQVIYR